MQQVRSRAWAFSQLAMAIAAATLLSILLYQQTKPTSFSRLRVSRITASRTQTAVIARVFPMLAMSGARLDTIRTPPLLVEFSDYQCPACRKISGAVDSLALGNGIGVSYHHFPLGSHPAASGAARSAICAEGQGVFRAMHQLLMTTTAWHTDTAWTRLAATVKVPDITLFETCLTSLDTHRRLSNDIALASVLGVRGTPTFLTRSAMSEGVLPAVGR